MGRGHPLEKKMATHSSILSEEFRGQRSLVNYSPWGTVELQFTVVESDMTEQVTLSLSLYPENPNVCVSLSVTSDSLRPPSLEDLPDPGIKPGSPALQADSLPSEPPGIKIYLFWPFCIVFLFFSAAFFFFLSLNSTESLTIMIAVIVKTNIYSANIY